MEMAKQLVGPSTSIFLTNTAWKQSWDSDKVGCGGVVGGVDADLYFGESTLPLPPSDIALSKGWVWEHRKIHYDLWSIKLN